MKQCGRARSASDGDEKDGVGACVDKVHSLTVDDKWFYIKPEHLCLRRFIDTLRKPLYISTTLRLNRSKSLKP